MKTFAEFDSALAERIRTLIPAVRDSDPLVHVLDMLREVRDDRAEIDDVLIVLLKEERDMNVYEMDEIRFRHRAPTDVLITDVKESDLQGIGAILGKPNLSTAVCDHYTSVTGIMYGWQNRVFISLPVRKLDVVLNVLFLFDTGSQGIHLCHSTFAALGYKENVPSTGAFYVNGFLSQASLSRDHYQDVNILGQEYMRECRATLHLDYDKLKARFTGLVRSPH